MDKGLTLLVVPSMEWANIGGRGKGGGRERGREEREGGREGVGGVSFGK